MKTTRSSAQTRISHVAVQAQTKSAENNSTQKATTVNSPKTVVVSDAFDNNTQLDPEVVKNTSEKPQVAMQRSATTPAKGLQNSTSAITAEQLKHPLEIKDLDKLSPEDKQKVIDARYNYLHNVVNDQANGDPSAWKTGENELNLVGVRSMSHGQHNDGAADKYNDTIYACRIHNGKKEVVELEASVDPGKWDKRQALKSGIGLISGTKLDGIPSLADGFYDRAFQKSAVSGSDLGLAQAGWVSYHVDRNLDGIISANEKLGPNGKGLPAGAQARFQFHPGDGENVGTNSAGCQTIRTKDWGTFQQMLKEAPDSQKGFSYTLVDGKNLKELSAQDMQDKAKAKQATWIKGSWDCYGTTCVDYNRSTVNEFNKHGSSLDFHGFNAAADHAFLDSMPMGALYHSNSKTMEIFRGYDGSDGIGRIRQPFPSFKNSKYYQNWYRYN